MEDEEDGAEVFNQLLGGMGGLLNTFAQGLAGSLNEQPSDFTEAMQGLANMQNAAQQRMHEDKTEEQEQTLEELLRELSIDSDDSDNSNDDGNFSHQDDDEDEISSENKTHCLGVASPLNRTSLSVLDYHTAVFGNLPVNWTKIVDEESDSEEVADEKEKKEKNYKVFLENLSDKTTEGSLKEHFQQFGKVINCAIQKQRKGHYGTVEFSTQQDIDRALKKKYHHINGTKIKASSKKQLLNSGLHRRINNGQFPDGLDSRFLVAMFMTKKPPKYCFNDITFRDDAHITDAVIESWYHHLKESIAPRIESIDLRGCMYLTDWGVHWLAKLLKDQYNLIKIKLDGCENITEKGLLELCDSGPVIDLWCQNTMVASIPEHQLKKQNRFKLQNCPILQVAMMGFPKEESVYGPYGKVFIHNNPLVSISLLHYLSHNQKQKHSGILMAKDLEVKDAGLEPNIKDMSGKTAKFNVIQATENHSSYGFLTNEEVDQIVIPFDTSKSVKEVAEMVSNVIAHNSAKEVLRASSAVEMKTVTLPPAKWSLQSLGDFELDVHTGILRNGFSMHEKEANTNSINLTTKDVVFKEQMNNYYNTLELEVLDIITLGNSGDAIHPAVTVKLMRLDYNTDESFLCKKQSIEKGYKITLKYDESGKTTCRFNDEIVGEVVDEQFGYPTLQFSSFGYIELKVVNFNCISKEYPYQLFLPSRNPDAMFDESSGIVRFNRSVNDVQVIQGMQPITPEHNTVSIKILNTGNDSCITLGIVHSRYSYGRQPGWNPCSVALHCDDNGIFAQSGSPIRKLSLDREFAVGDVIKMVVHCQEGFIRPGDDVKLTYYRNGDKLTDVEISLEKVRYTDAYMVPAIGMHSNDECVQIVDFKAPTPLHKVISPLMEGSEKFLLCGKRNCLVNGNVLNSSVNCSDHGRKEFFTSATSLSVYHNSFSVLVTETKSQSIFSLGLVDQTISSTSKSPGNTIGSVGLLFDKTGTHIHAGIQKCYKDKQTIKKDDKLECLLVIDDVKFDEDGLPLPDQTLTIQFKRNYELIDKATFEYLGGGLYPSVCFGSSDIAVSLPNLLQYGELQTQEIPLDVPVDTGTQFIVAGLKADAKISWSEMNKDLENLITENIKKVHVPAAKKERARIWSQKRTCFADHQQLSSVSKMVFNLEKIIQNFKKRVHFVHMDTSSTKGKEVLTQKLLENLKYNYQHHSYLYMYTDDTIKALDKVVQLESKKIMTLQEIEDMFSDVQLGSRYVRKYIERLQQWGKVLLVKMDQPIVITDVSWFVQLLDNLSKQPTHKAGVELLCLWENTDMLRPRELLKASKGNLNEKQIPLLLQTLVELHQVIRLKPGRNEKEDPKYYLLHPMCLGRPPCNDTTLKSYLESDDRFITASKTYNVKLHSVLPSNWYAVMSSVSHFCTPVMMWAEGLVWHKGAVEFVLMAEKKDGYIHKIHLKCKTYLSLDDRNTVRWDVQNYLEGTFRIYQDIVDGALHEQGAIVKTTTNNIRLNDTTTICAVHQWKRLLWQNDCAVCTLCSNCCNDGVYCDFNGILDNKFLSCKCMTENVCCRDCGLCQLCAKKLWKYASLLRPSNLQEKVVALHDTPIEKVCSKPIDAMILNNFQIRVENQESYDINWGLLSEDKEEFLVFLSMCRELNCPENVYSCPVNYSKQAYNCEFFQSQSYKDIDSPDLYNINIFQPKVPPFNPHLIAPSYRYNFLSCTRIRFYQHSGIVECEHNRWNSNILTGFLVSKYPLTHDCFYYEVEILNTSDKGFVSVGLNDSKSVSGTVYIGYKSTKEGSSFGYLEDDQESYSRLRYQTGNKPFVAGDKIGVGAVFIKGEEKQRIFFVRNGVLEKMEINVNKELHGHIVVQDPGWKIRLTTRGVWRATMDEIHEAVDAKLDASKKALAWTSSSDIELSPASTLLFIPVEGEPNNVSSEVFVKAKPHLTYPVLFKVKVTSPSRYFVRPNKGIIKPGEVANITIIGKIGDLASYEPQIVKDKVKLEWKLDKKGLSDKNYGTELGFGRNKNRDGPFSAFDNKWTMGWNENLVSVVPSAVLGCKMGEASKKEDEKTGLEAFVKNIFLNKRIIMDNPKSLPKVTEEWPSHPHYILEVRKNGKLCSQSWIPKKKYYLSKLTEAVLNETTGVFIPRLPKPILPNSLEEGMKVYASSPEISIMLETLKDSQQTTKKLTKTAPHKSILKPMQQKQIDFEAVTHKKAMFSSEEKHVISDEIEEISEKQSTDAERTGFNRVDKLYVPCKIVQILEAGKKYKVQSDFADSLEIDIEDIHSEFGMNHLDLFENINIGKEKYANSEYGEVLWWNEMLDSSVDVHWDEKSKSPNVTLSENGTKYTRGLIAQCTDGARGTKGYNRGSHTYRFTYNLSMEHGTKYGSFFQIGVCTEKAALHRKSYGVVIGSGKHSFGWDITHNEFFHNGVSYGKSSWNNPQDQFTIDMKMNFKDPGWPYIRFSVPGSGSGVFGITCFEGNEALSDYLKSGEKLYPCAAGVFGNHTVKISLIYSSDPKGASNTDWDPIAFCTGDSQIYDSIALPYLIPSEQKQAGISSPSSSLEIKKMYTEYLTGHSAYTSDKRKNCDRTWSCTVQERSWQMLSDMTVMDGMDILLPSNAYIPLPREMDLSALSFPSLTVLMDINNLEKHFLCKPEEERYVQLCEEGFRLHLEDRPGTVVKDGSEVVLQLSTLACIYMASTKVLLPKYQNLFKESVIKKLPRKQLEFQIQSMIKLYAAVMHANFSHYLEKIILTDDYDDNGKKLGWLDAVYEEIKQNETENIELCSSHMYALKKQAVSDVMLGPVLDLKPYTPYNELLNKIDLSDNVELLEEIPDEFQDMFPNLVSIYMDQTNSLKKLPSSMKKLKKLASIWITVEDNLQVAALPEDIGELRALSELRVSRAFVKTLPQSICNATMLTTLSLSSNGLKSLPQEFGNLYNMTELLLNFNPIFRVPNGFGRMKHLTCLSLAGVGFMPTKDKYQERDIYMNWFEYQGTDIIKVIPKERAEQLYDTCKISQNGSHVTDVHKVNAHLFYEVPRLGLDFTEHDEDGGIPEEIFNLENLETLDLSNQAIRFVPPQISKLSKLEKLTLNKNLLLEGLPGSMGNMKKLRKIALRNCPSLKTPPNEVVSRGVDAVKGFLKRLSGGTTENWRTKLMLVGLGGAGKTSLLQALMSPKNRTAGTTSEEITDGIDIKTWTVKRDEMALTFSAWDFAGQDVYYNTHQFFLSGRAVYLLLWTCRLGYEHAGLDFWLSSIQCHAPKAPIFVIGTHCDQVSKAELPRDVILKKYPQIKGFFFVSSIKGTGIEKLKQEIIDVTKQESYMGESVPTVYLTLESRIIRLRKEKSVVPWCDVEKLAVDCGIFEEKDIKRALLFLHDLGAVQYFDNEFLRDHVVINPQWIVDVMACVVSIKDSPIQEGKFQHQDIDKVWALYPSDLHEWLLRLTEEFDLTFPIPSQPVNLVPCLLPQTEPKFDWPEITEGKRENMMLYRFTYLPAGLFNRTQVRLFQFSDGKDIWKRGSLLHKNEHIALIKQLSDKELLVKVQGPRPENILFLIHEVIESLIMESFHGVTYDYLIPCPDCISKGGSPSDKALFEASLIKKATEWNAPFLQCREHFHTVSMTVLQASMPPDSSVEFDVHLSESVRALEELRSKQPHDVFIHYCDDDLPKDDTRIHPKTIVQDMEKAGFACWFREKLKSIDIQEVTMALKDSKLMVVFMSNAFEKDKKCHELFLYAKHTLVKPFQVISYGENYDWKNTYLGGMEVGSHHVYVNMMQKERYPGKINELKKHVQGKLDNLNKQENTYPQCFISYAWGNSHRAHKLGTKCPPGGLGWEKGDPRHLKEFLQANSVSCWIDIEQTGKRGLFEDISDGIKHCDVMLACVSAEYAASKNCMMELRFAECSMEKPIIAVIVGTSDRWRFTEVQMLLDRTEAPIIDMQYANDGTLDKLLKTVKDRLSTSNKPKKLMRKTTGPTIKLDKVSFIEEYELAQRKFLRHVTFLAASMDTVSYPRLCVLDFVTKDRNLEAQVENPERPKSAVSQHEQRGTLHKRDSKLQQAHKITAAMGDYNNSWLENNLCVRFLCEHDGGCHISDTDVLLASDMSHAEKEALVKSWCAYLGRIYTLLKHSPVTLNFMGTEQGKHFLNFIYLSIPDMSGDFTKSYCQMRDQIMSIDVDRVTGNLGRCYLPTGQIRWLCSEHQKGHRITLLNTDVDVGLTGSELVTEDDRLMKKYIEELSHLSEPYIKQRTEGKNSRKMVDRFMFSTGKNENKSTTQNDEDKTEETTDKQQPQDKNSQIETDNKTVNRPKPKPRKSKSLLGAADRSKDMQSKMHTAGYILQNSAQAPEQQNSQACVLL